MPAININIDKRDRTKRKVSIFSFFMLLLKKHLPITNITIIIKQTIHKSEDTRITSNDCWGKYPLNSRTI